MSQYIRFACSSVFILLLLLGNNSIQAAPSCGSSSGSEAISICERAIEKRPRDVDLRVDYADVLVKQKKYEEAVSVLRSGIQLNPSSTELKEKYRLAKSFVHEDSGVQVLIDRPPAAGTKSSVNAILCKKLKGKRALDACSKLLRAEPANVFALMRQGEEFVSLKQYVAAIESYQKVLDLEPDNVSAKSQLIILNTKVVVRQPSVTASTPVPVVKKPPVDKIESTVAPVEMAPVEIAALPEVSKPKASKKVVFSNAPLSAGVTY